jgi:hypothetical protein
MMEEHEIAVRVSSPCGVRIDVNNLKLIPIAEI